MEPKNILEFAWDIHYPLYPVQRVILKLIYGLPLDPSATFDVRLGINRPSRTMTEPEYVQYLLDEGRTNADPESYRPHYEAFLSMGRRSGKNHLCNLMAVYETRRLLEHANPHERYHLRRGSQIQVLYVSPNIHDIAALSTADIIRGSELEPYLRATEVNSFRFRTSTDDRNVVALVLRGYTLSSASMFAGPVFFSSILNDLTDSSYRMAYNSLVPATRLATSHGNESRMISVESPSYTSIFNDLYRSAHTGGTGALTLSIPTWQANPEVPDEIYTRISASIGTESFEREFGAAMNRGPRIAVSPQDTEWRRDEAESRNLWLGVEEALEPKTEEVAVQEQPLDWSCLLEG